jgi:SulP family sulfate permease
VLWKQGEAADGLYVIGAGVLRATYHFAPHTPVIEESMVPGTLAGELSGLAGLARNATVVVERSAVLWRLSADALRRLEAQRPELARSFTALVLKGVCCHIIYMCTEADDAICASSRKIGLRYLAFCIGDEAMNE